MKLRTAAKAVRFPQYGMDMHFPVDECNRTLGRTPTAVPQEDRNNRGHELLQM